MIIVDSPVAGSGAKTSAEAVASRPNGTVSGPNQAMVRDWSFARRRFWLLSHVFALAVVVLFVNLGLWQLDRHQDRGQSNVLIDKRMAETTLDISDGSELSRLNGADPAAFEFRRAVAGGTYLEADFVRVVNRSQGGAAGEHVVGIFELIDGTVIAVNRGFVPSNADPDLASVPVGPNEVRGWLRASVEKGRFGVDDSGQGSAIPRFNTGDLSRRWGEPLSSLWLQLEDDDELGVTFPDPVPLPPVDGGPHLSYAMQWFSFAILGLLFYGGLLWRNSRDDQTTSRPSGTLSIEKN